MVRAEIVMIPQRRPHVRLVPASAGWSELLQLLLCYGAKLRWGLTREPAWLREIFKGAAWRAAVLWDAGREGWSEDGPPWPAAVERLSGPGQGPERCERYVIQLYSDEQGRGYPCGSLPPNPRRGNLVLHYLALLQAVAARLSADERVATQPALLDWWHAMFRESAQGASLGEHIAAANRICAAEWRPRGSALLGA